MLQVWETLSEHHAQQLLQLFAREWWTDRRSHDDVARMLTKSDVVIAIVDAERDQLAGFARALTDETYLAVVLDVIVADDRRGNGIGRMLIESMLGHPKIVTVSSIEVVCQPDLMPFYEQWGFTGAVGESRLMRRAHQDV